MTVDPKSDADWRRILVVSSVRIPLKQLGWFAALAFLTVVAGIRLWLLSADAFPWDFAINYTASVALRRGVSLYDHEALRRLGTELTGRNVGFTDLFTSYIGPPTTAFLHLPFSHWAFDEAVTLYRLLAIVAFVSAVFIAGYALRPPHRRGGWLLGLMCLLTWAAPAESLALGQLDCWITLAFAIGAICLNRQRYVVSGIALGLATILKVSPLVILLYAIARRRSSIAFAGFTTVGAFVAASTWFGGASDLRLFAFQVLPALSGASSSFQNVSLPAFAFRLFSHVNDFTRAEAGLGGWQYVAAPFTLVAMAALWSVSNQREGVSRHDYAALILVALLGGPLTWTHYVSWALVAVVLLADESPWRRRDRSFAWTSVALLAFGILAEVIPTQSFRPSTVAQHWWLRIATGINSFGLFALLAVAIRGKLTESQASRGQGLVKFVELPSLPKGVAQ